METVLSPAPAAARSWSSRASECGIDTEIIDRLSVMMAVCDGNTLIHINPSGMRLLGLARPSEAVGRSFFHFVHRDYADLAELGLDGFVEEAGKISIKLAQVGGGGVDAHLWVTRLNDEGLLLVEAHDITDHLRAAQSLRNREQRLEGIINSVADGILTVNGIGTIQTFNPAAESIFGYRRDEVIGKTLQMLIPDTAAGLAVDEPGWVRVLAALPEVIGRRKNGDAMPLELAVREVQQGDTLSYTGIVRDISARKAAEQRVFRMAHYDALTDLPNRNLFGDRLEEAHKRARRHGEKLAIFFVDLNRFKPINDTYGHAVGDAVLREVSRRLKAGMRATDTIARVGGDEFMVLLEELKDIPEVEEIRQKLLQVLSQPLLLGNRQLSIGASIGFAVYPDHSEEIAELIALADKDMYRHKEASRGAL